MFRELPPGLLPALHIALGTLGLFIALLAITAVKARLAVRLLAAASALGTAAYAACSSPGFVDPASLLSPQLIVLLVCAALPAIFCTFARSWFNDEYAPDWKAAAAIVILGALGGVSFLVDESMQTTAIMLAALRRLIAAALLANLFWQMWTDSRADLVNERLKARRAIVCVGGSYTLIVLLVELWLADAPNPPALLLLNLVAICTVTALTGIALCRWDLRAPSAVTIVDTAGSTISQENSTPAQSSPPHPLSPADTRLLEALEDAMVVQHLYRQEGLSIGLLSAQLGTQEHRLRRVIRQGLGMRNFNEFLHRYRLDEVAHNLREAEKSRIPILTLALEAGYASIGPFNRAFKQRYGMTPREYRR